MTDSTVPLIILGGSDRKPPQLPAGSEGRHPLSGCKGVDIQLDGRSLIEHIVDRLRACGAFEPIFVAGPAAAYGRTRVDAEVIDTDASFGDNIRRALETMIERFPGSPVAFTTCDILPDVGELDSVLDDYRQSPHADLWFPLVVADPDQKLGASAWKPKYRIVPEPGQEAVSVLPSHLTVIDPESLRLELLYRIFELSYRTRNRPIRYRRAYILRDVTWTLLKQDVLHVLALRLPTLTLDIVVNSMRTGNRIRRGKATLRELEDALRKVFVRRRHRQRHPDRRIRLPLTRAMTLARDIDTVEEAEALGATFA
ncbi:MAG: NTP transferase domain-containing protein [Thermoanaerobaculia bacterium]|nr:NTP transferase domain-containing protein [Thermoanaerobaculia bacterium]